MELHKMFPTNVKNKILKYLNAGDLRSGTFRGRASRAGRRPLPLKVPDA